jgi:hypothetical protein
MTMTIYDNGAVSLTAKANHPLYIASERPIMSSHTSNNSGDTISGGLLKGNLWGAPFPPRPKAIATFLASADFVPGCQTLLHSLKVNICMPRKENCSSSSLVTFFVFS